MFSLFDHETRKTDLWVLDLERDRRTRLTFDPGSAGMPFWSPDGSRVAFMSNRSGVWELYTKELFADAREERLVLPDGLGGTYLRQWSSDGRWLVFSGDNKEVWHLWALPLDTRKPILAVPAEFNEWNGRLSPDSRRIAYTSDESGPNEIYLRWFPSSGRHLRVSMAGGDEPVWRSDGRELYFIASDNTLMAVPVRAEDALEVGTPRALFNLGPRTGTVFWHSYDVTRDGQRFLVARSVGANSGPALTVVVNWTAALKK